jgi:UDP-N-acetylmuramyl pentapeptide synthase
MNELGKYGPSAHTEIGELCDPKQVNLVVTIGPEANKYLAAAAEANGCEVKTFDSPYAVGDYLKPLVEPGAAILVKGSQNRVFSEEAIKSLLANQKDTAKLVRQSSDWMAVKKKAFGK